MTEQLKTLLTAQSESVDFAHPDLDAILRDGDRLRRRRRTTRGLGAAAVVALVAGGVVFAVGPGDGGDGSRVADTPPAVPQLTWATGSTLHTPDGDVEVGHRVVSYVRTDAGFAVADDEGGVFAVVDREVSRIGSVAGGEPELVGDTDGSLVGWSDPSGGLTVVDLAKLDRFEWTYRGPRTEPLLLALDERTALVREGREVVGIDLDTGVPVAVPVGLRRDNPGALEDGVMLIDRGDDGTDVTRLADGTVLRTLAGNGTYVGNPVVISDDARYASGDADEPQVWDLQTGELVDLGLDVEFATGYEWLDARTLAMIAAPDLDGAFQLWACTVPDGECTVVVEDVGTLDEIDATQDLALPTGQPLG